MTLVYKQNLYVVILILEAVSSLSTPWRMPYENIAQDDH